MSEDGGVTQDSGQTDSGTQEAVCGLAGTRGGLCRVGNACVNGVTCFPEVVNLRGAPVTLGILDIPAGTPDPENEGEFIAGDPSTVPISFAPGGQCSNACNPQSMTNTCGRCSTCSTTLGGSDAWGAIGIQVRTFDITDPRQTSATNPGICRLNCVFNPETRGGCPEGYTCDPSENICVEACTADSQCNASWGLSRSAGLVSVPAEGTPFTCNTTTGRCDWTPPASAAVGAECDSSADCPADVGFCALGGRCNTYQCLPPAGSMTSPYPCPANNICARLPGNDPSFCLQRCTAPADCFDNYACRSDLIDGGSVCFGICTMNAQCKTTQRCDIGGFADATLGTCKDFCDPAASNCAAGEICQPVMGETYGFCEALNQLCSADADCFGTQACEFLGADGLGRCVDGCASNTDCTTAGETCRIQPERTRGVCRAPGEPCAPSGTNMTTGMPLIPLRGNAQCPTGQTCSSTMPDMLGTCR